MMPWARMCWAGPQVSGLMPEMMLKREGAQTGQVKQRS